MSMRVGIWERNEGICAAVRAGMGTAAAQLYCGSHPAEFAAAPLDLLCVSPGSSGWAGAGAVHCRTVLLPGTAGPLARALRCAQTVSYGTSPRDSLTFSSLEGGHISLALQRELVTLDGTVLEQQELILPFPQGGAPLPVLAAAGTLLLMGVPPQHLMAVL